MAPKGVSQRTLLAKKKGIKVGMTVCVSYREDGKGPLLKYEGKMGERRIGGTDRESYIELKNCMAVGSENEILGVEGVRRLYDAWIEDINVAEKRSAEVLPPKATKQPGISEKDSATGGKEAQPAGCPGTNSGCGSSGGGGVGGCNFGCGCGPCPCGGCCCGGCGCGGCGCGGCPCGGCGCGGCGCGGCGCGGCGCNGYGCGGCCGCCGGCGCGMSPMMNGMGMNPMMMGVMNPMMNPMGMAAMGMGMAAMMSAAKGMAKDDEDEESEEEKPKQSKGKTEPVLTLSDATESQDVTKELLNIDEGAYVRVRYTHPQLGKTVYEGTLQLKFIGTCTSQSYIQLSQCKRYDQGQVEEEALKRLMTGFVDEIKVCTERSRSRSRRRSSSPARS